MTFGHSQMLKMCWKTSTGEAWERLKELRHRHWRHLHKKNLKTVSSGGRGASPSALVWEGTILKGTVFPISTCNVKKKKIKNSFHELNCHGCIYSRSVDAKCIGTQNFNSSSLNWKKFSKGGCRHVKPSLHLNAKEAYGSEARQNVWCICTLFGIRRGSK